MRKSLFSVAAIVVLCVSAFVYFLSVEPPGYDEMSSTSVEYERKSAEDKQKILWSRVQETVHSTLPATEKMGAIALIRLAKQELTIKGRHFSDFAPVGWKKYIHSRGAIAMVKIVSQSNNRYTGVFQGADHALLRLSLTYQPKDGLLRDTPVAPGLALKVLRDGMHAPQGVNSANISALVALDGQGMNYNFFAYPMSNIVPVHKGMGQRIVHNIFDNVSDFPEQLKVDHMAEIDARGRRVEKPVAPTQLFFVPNSDAVNFRTDEHEVREDFLQIPPGTLIYRLYALDKPASFDYRKNYKAKDVEDFRKAAIHIADIITTSPFLASEFGDNGIFFRHQFKYK